MNYRSRAVITGRAAEKHLEGIKSEHAELLNGMSVQSQRVQQANQQRKQQQFQQHQSDREFGLKQQELTAKSYGTRTN